jgi:hypothetical protein
MAMLQNDAAIDAIVDLLMLRQSQENENIPVLERELREINTNIENLLNAIQQGILTRSTKARLEELEEARDEVEAKLARERMARPTVSAEFMRFWLERFRKLDITQKTHRKALIDTFVNAIFLYDDRMEISYNFTEGSSTISLSDLKAAKKPASNGSNMESSGVPLQNIRTYKFGCFFIMKNE